LAVRRLYPLVCVSLSAMPVMAQVVVDAAVLEAVASGRTRVVVELNVPGFTPEGRLDDERAQAQREAIAASQEKVMYELARDDMRLIRLHRSVPFLSLEVGPSAVAKLQARADLVVRIIEDRTAAANQSE
jgi:hypothetical protein